MNSETLSMIYGLALAVSAATGLIWMRVSKPIDERSQEIDDEEEEATDGRPEGSVRTEPRINIHSVDNLDQAPQRPPIAE
jgi:hypothetical protein